MIKRIGTILLAAVMLAATGIVTTFADSDTKSVNESAVETTMDGAKAEAKAEYEHLIGYLSDFPVSFVYDGQAHRGFGRDFTLKAQQNSETGEKIGKDFTFLHSDGKLQVDLKTAFYPDYGAYEWTVWFSAATSENTGVIEQVIAADMTFRGEEPVLKGINGDYGTLYSPYEIDDLTEGKHFEVATGRPTGAGFPYFDLQHGKGGTLIAIGWPGTWSADFKQVSEDETEFDACGTLGMQLYLKEGESVRTPLVSFVKYGSREDGVSTNTWRKWYIDCNLPLESGNKPIGKVAVCLPGDRNGDPSLDTIGKAMYRSMENIFDNGMTPDILWIDAGWYCGADGKSVSYFDPASGNFGADWGRTGTWELDQTHWSNMREITDFTRANGTKVLLWFEPERVGEDDRLSLEKNYGLKADWLIGHDRGFGGALVNLGNPDCLEYMFGQICDIIDTYGIDHYREDFNFDPAPCWKLGDVAQGSNRVGITENLHVQGHLKLWDMLLERYPDMIIDSCASGGGRNDLESMRRAVPYHRTDAEEFEPANTSISMNSTLFGWLPYFGSAAYTRRDLNYVDNFNTIDAETYDRLNANIEEYRKFTDYLYGDYYLLTPWHSPSDLSGWTAWEFFDAEKEEGVIQLFRQDTCEENVCKVSLRGLNPDAYYKLYRFDGSVVQQRVKGSFLMSGNLTFRLSEKHSSDVIFIEKA